MKGYVISRMNGTNPKGFLVPKLYNYMRDFEVKASTGATLASWCVVIVDDATKIPPAAEADPDIFVFDTEAELNTVLTAQRRSRVNAALAQTTWNVTVVNGDTVRSVLGKIRAAVGDSIESWGLGV